MFGYVVVPKNIEWFKMLLAHTLPISEDDPDTRQFEAFHRKLQSIKPSQTIGTVLALNGWRYYFCMYHPMHAPSMVSFIYAKNEGWRQLPSVAQLAERWTVEASLFSWTSVGRWFKSVSEENVPILFPLPFLRRLLQVGYKPRAPKNSAKNFVGFEDEDTTSNDDESDNEQLVRVRFHTASRSSK